MWANEGWRPYRTEWVIFDDEYQIAGTIDAVYYKINRQSGVREYAIIDWKRSKRYLKQKNYPPTCFHPLEALDSSQLTEYQIQINIYKFILENKYNLSVTALIIVQLNPTKASVKSFPLSSLKQIKPSLDCYRNQIKLQRLILEWEQKGKTFSSLFPCLPSPVFYENRYEYLNKEQEEVGEKKKEESEEEEEDDNFFFDEKSFVMVDSNT